MEDNLTLEKRDMFEVKRYSKWTAELVEMRFESAFRTLKLLPPVKAQGYFNVWPDIKYTRYEKFFQEAGPNRLQALPGDISRMEETITWTPWVDVPERKLIWKRAAGVRWKTLEVEMNRGRTTLWTQYKLALSIIAERLNCMGVAPRQ